MEEADLIQHAVAGDAEAWDSLMRAHQEAVFRLAYLLSGDPDDADDVAQETFLRAWKYLTSFDTTRAFRPWLLSITGNLASNRRRSAGRYFAVLTRAFRDEPKAITMEEQSTQHNETRELWEAVKQLPVPDQQIIYLRFFLDLSVNETAEALQVAEGTVKSRLSRALGKLRTVIKHDFPVLVEESEYE